MLSLIEKFEKVEIKNEARVNKEDIEFCMRQEESYRSAIEAWKEAQKLLRTVMDDYGTKKPIWNAKEPNTRVYMSESEDMDFTKKRITSIKGEFIDRICSYFEQKYTISINSYEIRKKYKSNLTHQDIIDEIFIQLDGLNFGEKSVQELKDKVRKGLSDKRIEVKNKKLIIPNVITIDDFAKKWDKESKLSYGCYEKVNALFKGLSHFEDGKTETSSRFNHLSKVWTNKANGAVFITHEINLNKVVSVKPFQNGKVEVNFSKRELAREFAAEYLDHV